MLRGKPDYCARQKPKAPGRLRALAFALTLPFLSSPIAHASMAKRQGALPSDKLSEKQAFSPDCVRNGQVEFATPSGTLTFPAEGEVACAKDRAFVLNGAELAIIIPSSGGGGTGDGEMGRVRTIEMQPTIRRGILYWLHSDDTAYFFAKDRTITEIPSDRKVRYVHTVPLDLDGSKSVLFEGVMFIAPKTGNLVGLTFEGGVKIGDTAIVPDGSDFRKRDGRLFYGKSGNVELKISSNKGGEKIISWERKE